MSEKVVSYFNGDTMAASVWQDKYCLKDRDDKPVEENPTDMHWRMAKEFARVEFGYIIKERYRDYENLVPKSLTGVSEFGMKLLEKRFNQTVQEIEQEFFNYFDKFAQIVPQGSVMSNLGDFFRCGSLSNCFGIASPYDSYGGIFTTDQHIAQLEKRRGGVGANISTLRHTNAFVANSARSSTGVPSFAERFSNTTREVAQEGRRGALMLLLMCNHPDIFKFASMKDDRTKVTGANVSVMFTEKFMKALEEDKDFLCTFPINADVSIFDNVLDSILTYNTIIKCSVGDYMIDAMKIKPQELFDLVAEMAWKNGEPGVAYYDRVVDYCPEGVYPQYMPRVCNPCGEQWFAFNETCRLIAINFWSIVINHFEDGAALDMDLLYELAYMQQRLGDNLVDLEVEYIDRILEKLATDPEPQHVKQVEIDLWLDIRRIAKEGRRTGNGFTALGDMLAAIGMKYDSPEGIATTEMVMKTKMRAELDCTIDMAILRGTFVGWYRNKEFTNLSTDEVYEYRGNNSFFTMLMKEFPEQASRMYKYGRRNTNWSTVAPTGTVSLMCQTTSGMEPLFKAYYIRRRKINPSEAGTRVDFTDELGDTWQEYAVLHPKFIQWYHTHLKSESSDGEVWYQYEKVKKYMEQLDKNTLDKIFKMSPYYSSEADDISWEKRIDIQAIIQKYTSNAISSTINLPKDIPQQVVKDIYLRAYHKGLKGVTVYRDTSRSGVLITETSKTSQDQFGYTDAIKRPEELEAHYYSVQVRGKLFAVIVGLLNNLPYELFAFEGAIRKEEITGKLVKIQTGIYSFISPQLTIENVQLSSDHTDEKLLTRMCSQLLRHGVNPKYIVEQVEKSEVTVVSFAKAIVRVLKKYIPDEEATGETCNECKQPTIIYEEGCKKCTNCGSSRC